MRAADRARGIEHRRSSVRPDAPADLLREGWKVPVEHLGLPQATQFVVLLERGKGDSVAEIAEFWGETDVDDIHRRILEWKKR